MDPESGTEHQGASIPSPTLQALDLRGRRVLTAGEIVLTALFFALLTGLGEAAILLVLKVGFGLYIHFEPQVAWMSPVAQLIVFATPTLLLLFWHVFQPRIVTLRVVVGVFVFMSIVSLMLVHQKVHSAAIGLLALGLAVEFGRRAMTKQEKFLRRIRRTTPAFVALVLVLAIVTEGSRAIRERRELSRLPDATAGTPNVLFIILDTVRALNLSLYGYARPTTPNLERLAKRGIVFDRAVVTAPSTLFSHLGMLTGHWPTKFERTKERPLKLQVPTITEVLRDNGYHTAGFVANTWFLSRESGLTGGFIHYEDFDYSFQMFLQSSAAVRKVITKRWFRHFFRHHQTLARKDARQINEDFLDWLPTDRSRPFFAFMNYMDGHAPYLPPPPFDTIFDRRVRGRAPPLGEERNKSRKPADVVEVEVAAYDGSIAYLDHKLGQLFEELDRRGVLENTLIVVTADHGEELAERGDWGHGHTLYLEQLRVPLIIAPPPSKGSVALRISSPVSVRSLPSTLVDLTGVRTKAVFPGRSLASHWRSGEAAPDEAGDTVLAQLHGRRAVLRGRYHYFSDHRGNPHLYDHYDDLSERKNLSDSPQHQPVLDSLRALANTITPVPTASRRN